LLLSFAWQRRCPRLPKSPLQSFRPQEGSSTFTGQQSNTHKRTPNTTWRGFNLRGLHEGFAFADVKAINETGRRLFCWPEQLVIVDDQLIDMVDRYAEKYQMGDFSFSLVAALALTDAFPCKKP
jgi:hypothetical protein